MKFFCFLSLIILSFGFVSSDDKTIGEIGISELVIDRSTLKDIKKVFPNGTKKNHKIRAKKSGHLKFSSSKCLRLNGKKYKAKYIKYLDEKNGLIFNLGSDNILKTIQR